MECKYKAFISYSHRDTTFATWLHKTLETFSIPKSFIGNASPIGVVPSKLFPIFRDREELPTATDLGQVIENALTESASLLVLCSPRSAASMWVNQEVVNYQRIHGPHNIIALIIDGDFAPEQPEQNNVLVPALQTLLNPNVPFRADNQLKIIDARGGKAQRQQAFVGLLSHLLAQPMDAVQRSITKRRRLHITLALAAMIAFTSILAVIQQYYTAKQHAAEQAEIHARIDTQLDVIQRKITEQHYAEALQRGDILLQQHVSALSVSQQNKLFAQLHNALSNNQQVALLNTHQASITKLLLNQENTRLLSMDGAGMLILWDTTQWREVKRWQLNSTQGYIAAKEFWFSTNGNKFVIYSGDREKNARIQVFNSEDGVADSADLNLTDAGIIDVPFWLYQADTLITRRIIPRPTSDTFEQWLDLYDLKLQKIQSIQLPECGDWFSLQLVIALPQAEQALVADDQCGGFVYDKNSPTPINHLPKLKHSYFYFQADNSYIPKHALVMLSQERGYYTLWDMEKWQQRLNFSMQELTYFKINPDDQSIDVWGCKEKFNIFSQCASPVAQHISEKSSQELSNKLNTELQQKGRKWSITADSWLIESYKKLNHIITFENSHAEYTTFNSSVAQPALTVSANGQWYLAASGNQLHVTSLRPTWHSLTALPFEPDDLISSPSGRLLLISQKRQNKQSPAVSYISDARYNLNKTSIPFAVDRFNVARWSPDEHWVLFKVDQSKQILVNTQSGQVLAEFELTNTFSAFNFHAAFSSDSSSLTTYDQNGSLHYLELTPDRLISTTQKTITDHNDSAHAALTLDGSKLAIANYDNQSLTLYDARSGEELARTSHFGFTTAISSVHFSSDSQYIFVSLVSAHPELITFTSNTLKLQADNFPTGYWLDKVISKDLMLLANNNSSLLWSIPQQSILLDLTPYLDTFSKHVRSFHWYIENQQLVLHDEKLLLDLTTTPVIHPLRCDGKAPDNFTLNAEQQLLLASFAGTGFDDGRARLCVADLTSGNVLLNITLPSRYIRDLLYQAETNQITVLLSGGLKATYQLQHNDIDRIKEGAAAVARNLTQ